MSNQSLSVRIGFAGHRTLPESTAGPGGVSAALETAFLAISASCRQLSGLGTVDPRVQLALSESWAALSRQASPESTAHDGYTIKPVLLSGYAEGADRIATTAWRSVGAGPLHGVLPYCDAVSGIGYDAPPEQSTVGVELNSGCLKWSETSTDPLFDVCTALDGLASGQEMPRREPFLEQSRFLVRWSDIIVVVWRGDMPAGPGGTGDTVRLAITRGLPTVWIDPSRPSEIRLIDPRTLWEDGSFFELTRAIATNRDVVAPVLTAEELVKFLNRHFWARIAPPDLVDALASRTPAQHGGNTHGHQEHAGEPHDLSEGAARLDHDRAIIELNSLGWGSKRRRLLADRWPKLRGLLSGPVSTPSSPAKVNPGSTITADPGFQIIIRALKEADDVANVYGNLHRTLQVILMIIAVIAVFVGTLPAAFGDIKLYCVLAELLLAVIAWRTWRLRSIVTNHQRWSDARRYAERLRVIEATWPLGFDVNDDRSEPPTTWTEWRARAVLRLAGPPTGAMTEARLRDAAIAARDNSHGIVRGQEHYHLVTALRMSQAHHRTHRWESLAFWGLVAALALFATLYAADTYLLGKVLPTNVVKLSGGLLLVASATVPAFAAALIALEAKIGFLENAVRSHRLGPEFRSLAKQMGYSVEGDEQQTPPSVAMLAEALRAAGRLHIADADSWRDGATRRQIVKL